MWITLAIFSAFFLGVYDIFKKLSVDRNAVIPVLLGSTSFNLLFISTLFILSRFSFIADDSSFYTPLLELQFHGLLFAKAVLVLSSWICVFFSMKHLPITFVSPIRSTSPVVTLLGGVFLFNENLSNYQWLGVLVTFLFFFLYSNTGKNDGVSQFNKKWFYLLVLGTFLGGISGLYDKYLCNTLALNKNSVQFYYTFYQFLLLLPLVFLIWYPIRKNNPFQWRWSIPFIGVLLFLSDFLYFYALSDLEASISIVSLVRRGSVIVVFVLGYFVFKEQKIKQKLPYLLGLLLGIVLLTMK